MTYPFSSPVRFALAAGVSATTLLLLPSATGQTTTKEDRDVVVVFGQSEPRDLDSATESGSRLNLTNRETPAIVDVLTQEDFQTQGVRSAIEAMNAAPGVNAGNLPGAIGGASMRGFTRGAVNYLFDGVRMASSGAEIRNWDSWSFERIEVLKGPASVVSGEGALAGAINFVPKRPALGETSADFLASYGSQESLRLAAGGNAPLGEMAAIRGDLAYSQSAGWVDETDSETIAGTVSVLLKPIDKLAVTLSLDRFEDDFATAYFGLPLVAASVARNPSSIATGPGGLVADEAMRDTNYNVADGVMDSQSTWARAKMEYELSPEWSFVNEASWYYADRIWRNAEDFTFNAGTGLLDRLTTLISHDHQFWNDRAQVSFDGKLGEMRNRFAAGVEFGTTNFSTSRRFGSTTPVSLVSPVRGLFPTPDTPANFGTRQEVEADVDSTAVFVEDALNLTPDWLLVGGARLDQIDLTRKIVNVTTGGVTTYGNDYSPVSWRIGTVYNLQPQTQLFAQYSSAVTPVSGLLFISAANSTFDLSTGESFEAGIKSTLFEDRLQLTASAFHIRQDDILTRDPTNPAITIQGGSQISEGVEASVFGSRDRRAAGGPQRHAPQRGVRRTDRGGRGQPVRQPAVQHT